jgi:hypothetical protein
MKTRIATALLSIASVMGFSDEVQIYSPSANYPLDLKIVEVSTLKKSFGYVRMTVADPDLSTFQTMPGLGLGYRHGLINSAIDVSLNYNRGTPATYVNVADGQIAHAETFSYSIPVSYLRYTSNDAAPQSFYYGAGLGWAGNQKDGIYENGLTASATAGYEMYRTQAIHSFVQMDLSHPAINVSTTSVFSLQKTFKPLAQVSFGLGY